MQIKDKFCMNIHNLPINQQNIIITMAVLLLPNNKSGLMCYYLLKRPNSSASIISVPVLTPRPPKKKKKKLQHMLANMIATLESSLPVRSEGLMFAFRREAKVHKFT